MVFKQGAVYLETSLSGLPVSLVNIRLEINIYYYSLYLVFYILLSLDGNKIK